MRTLHIHGILHSRHSPLAALSQNLNWKCEVKMRTLHTHGILHSRHSPLEAILPKSELQMPKVFNGFHGSENSAGLIIRCNISKFYDVAMSIRVLLCTWIPECHCSTENQNSQKPQVWQFWHCSAFSERQLCGSSLYKMVWVETHRVQNSNQPKHKVWQTRKKMWRMSPSLLESENAIFF